MLPLSPVRHPKGPSRWRALWLVWFVRGSPASLSPASALSSPSPRSTPAGTSAWWAGTTTWWTSLALCTSTRKRSPYLSDMASRTWATGPTGSPSPARCLGTTRLTCALTTVKTHQSNNSRPTCTLTSRTPACPTSSTTWTMPCTLTRLMRPWPACRSSSRSRPSTCSAICAPRAASPTGPLRSMAPRTSTASGRTTRMVLTPSVTRRTLRATTATRCAWPARRCALRVETPAAAAPSRTMSTAPLRKRPRIPTAAAATTASRCTTAPL
mmetsp:Transcript_33634/g.73412  ORF Transcript_33634/g.73412 Transcript_33634/m.73412 type:complete len:269 (+) Transcript_33634:10674-11480(+)